jgi:RNA polymerase-binding protein DksA
MVSAPPLYFLRQGKKMDLETVKRKLADERVALLAREIPAPETARGDEGDMAAMAQVQEQSMRLASDQKQRLAQIDQVLARIAAGRYGICDTCGKPIPSERMEANPLATMCISCQSKSEKKRK